MKIGFYDTHGFEKESNIADSTLESVFEYKTKKCVSLKTLVV